MQQAANDWHASAGYTLITDRCSAYTASGKLVCVVCTFQNHQSPLKIPNYSGTDPNCIPNRKSITLKSANANSNQ